MRVVVIGAGIAGLAAAWALRERLPAAEIVVLESSSEVGGKLRLGSVAGQPVDLGAEAMLARRPEAVGLATSLGLPLISPSTTSARIRAGGAIHPLPARTMMGIPASLDAARDSGVLSADALARIETEPSLPPLAPLDADIAVGTIVRDRLGDEVADRLVEPLLGGVYAGLADALSLRATMPALAARLRPGGSLIVAAQAVTDVGTHNPSAGPVFASVEGGLGRLPLALAASGRFGVRTGVTARMITRTPTGFAIECGPVPAPESVEADAVVVATPAAKSAGLLSVVAPLAARELSTVDSASMAIVTFAFAGVDLPAGSGLLIGTREGFAVKAVTFSSQKWPGTPDGLTLLRASVGRAGETRDLQRDDADLISLVRADLVELTGVRAEPADAVVTRWGGGLPQYGVGHVELVERVRASVAEVPGLAVCGATFDGVGIPACIASATRAAAQVSDWLDARGE